ncbi:hypothetical protein ARTHRO9V_160271 [Arthrobacter sp. 9V]|nr:hypothetical protein ARTHRO9V_160271 [Arthrobacter sp. 9V]
MLFECSIINCIGLKLLDIAVGIAAEFSVPTQVVYVAQVVHLPIA